MDQYYYGANNSIQHANVNSNLSATVLALLEDPNRKFIEVEQAFFMRWWAEQTPAKQAAVKGLVASGQLEFINGGWSMYVYLGFVVWLLLLLFVGVITPRACAPPPLSGTTKLAPALWTCSTTRRLASA